MWRKPSVLSEELLLAQKREEKTYVFVRHFLGKKMAAGNFISTRHSEPHFEAETSEFRCEMKFWKSLHCCSEKLRMSLCFFIFKRQIHASCNSRCFCIFWRNDRMTQLFFQLFTGGFCYIAAAFCDLSDPQFERFRFRRRNRLNNAENAFGGGTINLLLTSGSWNWKGGDNLSPPFGKLRITLPYFLDIWRYFKWYSVVLLRIGTEYYGWGRRIAINTVFPEREHRKTLLRLLSRGLIFGTPKGNGRVSNLPPEKSHLPPEETFPVSPVATLPRTTQIYSNGTRWYFYKDIT